ncbi:hypothetical protein ABZ498_06540 [Streptomyces lavendulocolor]|uniref:hypothetical protein n=1 Tax=Streptomyces lavendulocolor TaxID=67316 RepID=UPI00340C511C
MRTQSILAAAGLLLAVTGCSAEPEPAKPPTSPAVTASPTPTVDTAQQLALCVDAIAALEPDADGSLPMDPRPSECAALDDSAYLDAYYDGLAQANQQGLDERQAEREDAEPQSP